jgi:hypothetical protein
LVQRLRKLVAPEIIIFGVPVVGVGAGVGLLTHSWEVGGIASAAVFARLAFPDKGSNGGGDGGWFSAMAAAVMVVATVVVADVS